MNSHCKWSFEFDIDLQGIFKISFRRICLLLPADTAEWMQPKVTGAVPASRGVHTCSVVGDYLVLFGGSAKFDPESRQCEEYFSDTHYIHTG